MPNGPTGLDACSPREMAARIETPGVAKAALPLVLLATLGVLAGVFIGFGAAPFAAGAAGAEVTGALRLLGGAAFALLCLAFWLSCAGRSVTDKVLAVLWSAVGFVALGFKLSVAISIRCRPGFWPGRPGTWRRWPPA